MRRHRRHIFEICLKLPHKTNKWNVSKHRFSLSQWPQYYWELSQWQVAASDLSWPSARAQSSCQIIRQAPKKSIWWRVTGLHKWAVAPAAERQLCFLYWFDIKQQIKQLWNKYGNISHMAQNPVYRMWGPSIHSSKLKKQNNNWTKEK